MRILWVGNALWCHTGYGVQAKGLLPRLARMGHEVLQLATWGLEGGSLSPVVDGERIQVLPRGSDGYGADVLPSYCNEYSIDLVITLFDLWPLGQGYRQAVPCRWAAWFPVDHEPLPDMVRQIAAMSDYPLTYSRFGQQMCDAVGLANTYIPHGIDCDVFAPQDREAARKQLSFPEGSFVAAMVGTNKGWPSRKSYGEAMEAFALFAEARPDLDPHIYVHCDYSTAERGLNLIKLARDLGVAERCIFVKRHKYISGLPDEYIAQVYSAADVLLMPSMCEGFGLPIAEAQACGCPVITTRYTSMPELTVNGLSVEPVQRFRSPIESWMAVASVERVAEALGTIADWDAETRASNAALGRAHFVDHYAWDAVVERYWVPFLAEVQGHVEAGAGLSLVDFEEAV